MIEGRKASTRWFGYGAPSASSVDRGNADEVAGANVHAARALIRGERSEELNDLSVDVDGDKAAAVGIEAGDGSRFVVDRALEGRRRT